MIRGALSAAQFAALSHLEAKARDGESAALTSIAAISTRAGHSLPDYTEAIESLRQHARIVLHFHPDRFGSKGASVAESLLTEGVPESI